jgi:hypothetical protein
MERKSVSPPVPQTEAQSTPSQSYAPPKATFVPLKLEERLLSHPKIVCALGCNKV